MAHPEQSSRSLEFFLDLGNLTSSVDGTVIEPPNTEAHWKAQGEGTWNIIEFTIHNAFRTGVGEESAEMGAIYWNDTVLGLENGPEPLFGFKVTFKACVEVITKTPIYGPTDPDTGETPIIGYDWNGTRSYPPAALNSAVLSNSQTRVPSLWPKTIDTPAEQAWADRIFDNRAVRWSTAIQPRRFEGITLYGCDQPTVSDADPGIVGIAEGHARCLGFIESRNNLTTNFVAAGDYYIEANTLQAFMRTPDNKIEPLITTNGGEIGRTMPMEGGGFAGRINHVDELPRSTDDNPIPFGTTYLERRDPELPLPFPGFIGTNTWSFVDTPLGDPDDPNGGPIRDRNDNVIEDFRWQRCQRPEVVSGYNYVLVFDESIFEYIERLGGPFAENIHLIQPALTGEWFPSEPWDPEADPPIYPMDTIPAFVPDSRETVDVHYSLSVSAGAASGIVSWSQTCIAPTRDWARMLRALLDRCYYTHDIGRSYADVPGYCNPESPQFGDNFTDPECMGDRGELVPPWIDPETGLPIPIEEIRAQQRAAIQAAMEGET